MQQPLTLEFKVPEDADNNGVENFCKLTSRGFEYKGGGGKKARRFIPLVPRAAERILKLRRKREMRTPASEESRKFSEFRN